MRHDLRFRPPRPDDVQAVTELLNACSMADIGVPDTTAEEVLSSWHRPNRDVDRDVILAELDGQIAGYVELDAMPPWTGIRIDGYVHPAFADRGIGSALLDRGKRRAEALSRRAPPDETIVIYHGAWHGTAAAAFLRHRGWEPARTFWRMRIEMDGPPPSLAWPGGIVVRAASIPEDEVPLHAAMEEAFADHWDHRPVPFDRWIHDYRTHPGYDPTLWFVAWEGREIAGAVICRRFTSDEPDCAWIDDVGVRPPWRRRGVAMALLLHGFHELYRRGIRKAALMVDAGSAVGAPALYDRAGMIVHRRIDVFRKVLISRNARTATKRAQVTPTA